MCAAIHPPPPEKSVQPSILFVSSNHFFPRLTLQPDNPVSIPILAELVPDGIKPGTLFLVEFDPESHWLALATTITASYLRAGGRVCYVAQVRSPETVRENLLTLGVDVSEAINEGRFHFDDWYTATLTGGRLETGGSSLTEPIGGGGLRWRSLKVADLSVQWSKDSKQGLESSVAFQPWPPGALSIMESASQMLRFNEEKPYLEWLLSRDHPNVRRAKRISLDEVLRGVHTESFYKNLESDFDAVIDLRVMERDEEVKNLLRLRSLKGQRHDTRWHEIQIKRNGEAIFVT